MTPEEKMVSNTTWLLEFWKDYKSWLPKDKLIEKYRWVISYEELLERFIGLYIEKENLKKKLDNVADILYHKE